MSVIILFCLSFLLVEYISWHFKGEKVQKNTQIVMCFLLLFIFFGFRDLPILNDTAHYYRHVRHLFSNTPFDNTPWYTFDSSSNFEEGFQIFLRIIGLVISKEPYSLIIITSFITTASLLWFLNKSTSHVAFAVFVLMTSTLLLGCYSAIRQSLAVSVSYIFYWCYGDSKYLVTANLRADGSSKLLGNRHGAGGGSLGAIVGYIIHTCVPVVLLYLRQQV
jgi:hypothetical protein